MATQTNPFDALYAGVKQFLAELTDDEFASLVAEVRPPAEADEPTESSTRISEPKSPRYNGTDNNNSYPASWGYGR
ncbi:hypothetical protein JTZ10_10965 [Gordonia rubripertincta]|uniref:Uncharacterized protein n=1 Tax=Gordonia rubripertincta TaxID=36822 RepID=A0AAW4G4V3_GORRU|nr:hypothetical protein [Gordonia rubripertincta]MBM7278283.1 hypothetical protein [Gordonia rubripertincta]